MNEQWPSERHARDGQTITDSSFKTAQDFVALLNTLSNGLPCAFNVTVIWIVEQDGSLADLEQRIAIVVDAANLQTYPDSVPLLLAFACAAALAHSPSLQTWDRLNAFKHNSWSLEHWLGEAMVAYAKVNSPAGHHYVALVRQAFAGLDNFSLKSSWDRVNQERSGASSSWTQRRDKLDTIWWGLRGWHGIMNYREVFPLFHAFYELDPDEFIRTLSESSNPYLVSDLLAVTGIGTFSSRLSEWKRMVAAAPVAFENDGKWNGSVVLPLLLVEARNQLLQARQNLRTRSPTPDELDGIRQQIVDAAEVIAVTLIARQDAPSIVARWTPWLMRQVLMHTSQDLDDVTSSAFADDALIDAIGSKLRNRVLPQTSPEDAALWEPWCYRCVLSSFAYDGHIAVPAWEDFGMEWRLTPEDWQGKKGRVLCEHASLMGLSLKEVPGIAANRLAYPTAQSPSPGQVWIGLWHDALTLREIVEFGDPDATEDTHRSRSDAGQLLLLLFRIGLAIFDQGAARCTSSRSPEAKSLVDLYRALVCATYEMRDIDTTLNREEWLAVVQHLTIRRMIWQESGGDESQTETFQIFTAEDTPTVVDLLTQAKGNVIELVAILQSLLLNGPKISRLKADLNSASISLPDIVHSIRRLNQLDPRRYPIDEGQLEKLEAYA